MTPTYGQTTMTIATQSPIPPAQADTFAASLRGAYNSRFVEPTRVQRLTDETLMVSMVTGGYDLSEQQAGALHMAERHATIAAHLYAFKVTPLVTRPFTPRWLR
jgi:hypothetical protein